MPRNFFDRLEDYFTSLGEALRGNAQAASIFPNSGDKGTVREEVLKAFLENHLPSSCNVILGGFLFNMDGQESKQLDILVTTDISPQYRHFGDKSFACVDGAIAVISVKSKLDTKELRDALSNIASIPPVHKLFSPLEVPKREGYTDQNMWLLERRSPINYYNWPFKVIFASDGIDGNKLGEELDAFYAENPQIPYERRPDLIYVSGKYHFTKLKGEDGKNDADYIGEGFKPDLYAPLKIIEAIQSIYAASRFIRYEYNKIRESFIKRDTPDAK